MGVDIGTSGVRAVLFNIDGKQICIDSHDYLLISREDGYAELEPDVIFHKTIDAINGCMARSGIKRHELKGVGISCQMHSLMCVDRQGNPLTKLIIWADTRAKKEAEYIEEKFDIWDLYKKTGSRVQHPMYPLSKILWLKNNEKKTYRKTFKFITIKEYIISKLYGEYLIDYTLAASQGFYNIHEQDWDIFILDNVLELEKDKFSEVVPCTFQLKSFKPEYENLLNIDRNTPVILGSGDGIMANIGCGVCDSTALSSTIGTSGAIRTACSTPLLDSKQRTWCYSFTEDMWVAGGAINNGGIALKWMKEQFRSLFEAEAKAANLTIYKLFDKYASEISPGSDNLIFLPCLMGERSPDWNPDVRGIMFGLSLCHGPKHIIRAAMEGIMYRMYSVYEAMAEQNDKAVQIKANGGYVKSDIWLQIQADIFNKEILVSGVQEASALGAAYMAMLSVGAVSDIRKLLPGMKPQKSVRPIPGNHEVYKEVYTLAKAVYENLYG